MTELINMDNTKPLDVEQDDPLGLYTLSIMFRKQANDCNDNDNKCKIVEGYSLAIELSNDRNSMINIGIYYENSRDFDMAKKYYRMAIDQYRDIDAMYNLGDIYKKTKDYANMKNWFDMVIATGIDGYLGAKGDGVKVLGDTMFYLGKYYRDIEDNYAKSCIYYTMAIKQYNHIEALFQLAWYYDEVEPCWYLAKEYYDRCISANPKACYAMYNMAIGCANLGDTESMLQYLNLAITNCNDVGSMHYLANYYHSIRDCENASKFYLMAVEFAKDMSDMQIEPSRNTLSSFTMMSILKSVENPGPQVHKYMAKLMSSCPEIMRYNNKIKLFTQLGHVVECGICYDEKLNIDLDCGHCVCTDCYPRVYNKLFPFWFYFY